MSFDPNTGLPVNASSAAAQQPTTMQQQPGVINYAGLSLLVGSIRKSENCIYFDLTINGLIRLRSCRYWPQHASIAGPQGKLKRDDSGKHWRTAELDNLEALLIPVVHALAFPQAGAAPTGGNIPNAPQGAQG